MLQLNHGRFGLVSHITSLQSLTGISAPEPVALNIDFLLTQWRYEDEVAPSERARVLKGLEDTGTKFWNVFALQVRTQFSAVADSAATAALNLTASVLMRQ